MVDILHRIAVERIEPESVYDALTTIDGLAGWWTEDTTGDAGLGGTIVFRFPPGGFDLKVIEAVPNERVTWLVTGGPAEWIDTTIEWRLRVDGDWTVLLFAHRGWAEPVEFMHHCSTKWASYLMSLKRLVETGKGTPSPHDVRVAEFD
ncbi:SRPBCC family protein [Gryllotalpicola protaetiae]|uniref:SRPBCC domain-containing protein n=1 Tax=Gryllotalpicola protaetiae TaxID=2419771 RepID=A0A387BQC6_9MICO|nr:SRPBCC domain-containing protein [Gryllotalpicola protaetiae]AYG03217.1 SRPBCC domain-containing protein [Gryllotalpicola protaetiae]